MLLKRTFALMQCNDDLKGFKCWLNGAPKRSSSIILFWCGYKGSKLGLYNIFDICIECAKTWMQSRLNGYASWLRGLGWGGLKGDQRTMT